jgi:hypothetical protein
MWLSFRDEKVHDLITYYSSDSHKESVAIEASALNGLFGAATAGLSVSAKLSNHGMRLIH